MRNGPGVPGTPVSSLFSVLLILLQTRTVKMLPNGSIKFEDCGQKFRPVCGMPGPHELFLGPGRGSPFAANNVTTNKGQKRQPQGYCEPCRISYSDIKVHCQSYSHQRFIENPTNFRKLDCVLDTLPTLSDVVQAAKKTHCVRS